MERRSLPIMEPLDEKNSCWQSNISPRHIQAEQLQSNCKIKTHRQSLQMDRTIALHYILLDIQLPRPATNHYHAQQFGFSGC